MGSRPECLHVFPWNESYDVRADDANNLCLSVRFALVTFIPSLQKAPSRSRGQGFSCAGPQPQGDVRPSALHLHRDGAHLVGVGGGDGEQPIAVDGLELLALDGDREAKAAAPGAVAEVAQQGTAGLLRLGLSLRGGNCQER